MSSTNKEARHGQYKATLGSSKKHQEGRTCGKTKTDSKAFTEKDTKSPRATSRKSEKVTKLNPDSAAEREVMSKEQNFRSEDIPFGIANGKSQISNMESAICDLKFRVLARTRYSRFAPRSLFNCGIGNESGRDESRKVCAPAILVAPVIALL